jgi:alcohol dehydrogenase
VAGDLGDLELRSRMLEASLLAGLAIARTRTALAHSMSYPITARYGVPHGLACGFTLPAILEFNAAEDDGRLADIASHLGLASTHALREALRQLLQSLGVTQALRQYIPSRAALLDLAPRMLTPGRADNNLRAATTEDVRQILNATDLDEYDTWPIGASVTTTKEHL